MTIRNTLTQLAALFLLAPSLAYLSNLIDTRDYVRFKPLIAALVTVSASMIILLFASILLWG